MTYEQLKKWHKHFVWFPERTDKGWIWLQTVERRLVEITHDPYGSMETWSYRRLNSGR